MYYLRIVLLSFFCLLTLNLFAQKKADALVLVDVRVVDQDQFPLPGATITISGKAQGVVTDGEGKASLWVDRNSTIEFNYLGMKPLSMKVNKAITGDIVLEDDMLILDQVVVTGYQRTTKRRSTGSLATLSVEELKTAPMANMDMLMQGKIAGVDVKSLSGRPGEASKIRIRGTNTISGNADPLWVIDGVPLQRDLPKISSSQIKSGDFNDIFSNGISGINPNDIESVTVLKDASAAAIYGSRAAGGVIVVTTKRGKEGKMQINYSANLSMVTSPARSNKLMNSSEKLAWEQELWDEFSAKGFATGGHYPVIGAVGMIRSGYGKYSGLTDKEQDLEIKKLGTHSTDWFDELFRNSISQSHYLSLSGGGAKNSYYVSFGYSENNGLVKKTDYDRYNVNTKLDMHPNTRVKLGLSADLSLQKSNSPSLNVDPFTYAYFANPYERIYNEDGSYAADNTYYSITHANGSYDRKLPDGGYNIFREINETSNKTKNFSASLIANLNVKILENLSFEGLASYGYMTDTSDNINGKNTFAAWSDRPFDSSMDASKRTYGSITQTSAYNTNYNLRGQFHYSKTFGEHHYISGLLGSEIRGQYSKSIYEKRYGYDPISGNSSMPTYPEDKEVDYSDLLAYAAIMDGLAGQSIMEETFASFYISLDYVLMQRYIASITARTDGSNNFGSDEQFNPTGSLGLSWNIDQEEFMKPLKSVISSLSLRTAIGYTGNINKSVYPQLVMDYLTSFRKTDGDYYRMGSLKNAPNPHLRWEKTRDMKVSLDIGFFKDRLRLQTELYDRRTKDAVTQVLVPYTTGFTSQSYNTSELLNQGVEFSIFANVLKTRDWNLSLSANISHNRNKLLKYSGTNSSVFGRSVGYPLGALISGKVKGIDKMLGIYAYETRPDVEMNTAADRGKAENYAFYLGTQNAPTNGGYSISVAYKKLHLSLGGSYSVGGKVLNQIKAPVNYVTVGGGVVEHIPSQQNDLYVHFLNTTRDSRKRWTPENRITNANPRLIDAYGEFLGLSNYMVTSSSITNASMIENVSYLKLNSLLLSYGFDSEWMKRANISSLSISFSMNNLFTLTNYSGVDPETPGVGYPVPRTYSVGLSVGF